MRCYLVTGGCGFIGSHLVDRLLADGHDVRVLDDLSSGRRENLNERATLIVGDVCDAAVVKSAMDGADGCFHLAAVSSVQRSTEAWAATHSINQTGAINLFEAARSAAGARPVPVVFASSAAVYGDSEALPLQEAGVALPISPYGADKLGCEFHARAAARVFEGRFAGLRFFNVFGPRQDPASPYSGVISIFADRALRGLDLMIFGDGEQVRDFIHVSDVVRCMAKAMAFLEGQPSGYFSPFNVCRGERVSVNMLAQAVLRASGSTVPISHGPARCGDIRYSQGDPAHSQSVLGFAAEITLIQGLTDALTWIKNARH
ncbi:epimerase [Paramagnetospirillum kuznetsovii]|uniref:Epimerase n=1 Tax=Paramagnetospirillum kuznetsovii TaxID=2053833 RepID=A0A364NXY6_9PROT|nr:epimerase [Paramagnetospirillum kuznetsovii]